MPYAGRHKEDAAKPKPLWSRFSFRDAIAFTTPC